MKNLKRTHKTPKLKPKTHFIVAADDVTEQQVFLVLFFFIFDHRHERAIKAKTFTSVCFAHHSDTQGLKTKILCIL